MSDRYDLTRARDDDPDVIERARAYGTCESCGTVRDVRVVIAMDDGPHRRELFCPGCGAGR